MKDKYLILTLMIIMGFGQFVYGQDWEKLINLKGSWKFSIGDDKDWAKPNYDDQSWDYIRVPSPWEDQGYNGYDGYAWYRKHIKISSSYKGYSFRINLGQIDDVDQVFFNGSLIGSSGEFPPYYNTAYNKERSYYLTERLIQFDGDNVIAVRVYDSQLSGGITNGDIGLFVKKYSLKLDVDLSGLWKFKIGDDIEWKEKNLDDRKWDPIIVPGFWEGQGYPDYDGFAWYRVNVTLPDNLLNKKLVLVLGRIDDYDEAYINGTLVGNTGDMVGALHRNFNGSTEYQKFRGYYIPDGLIQNQKEITIAVRVYDGFIDGGIYDGPIGLITQEKYAQHWKNYKQSKSKKSFWDFFFN